MGVPQIENPALAFSSAGQDNTPVVSNLVMTLPVGTTVLINQIVVMSYSSTTGEYTIAPAAAATASQAIGVTTSAGAVGALVEVVISGPTAVTSGASLATGAVVGVGATGALAAASATLGSNIGVLLASVATGATGQIFVYKS